MNHFFKKYYKKLLLISFLFLFIGTAPTNNLKIIKHKNSKYVLLSQLTKKMNIEQSFDIITQKGKLFYKGHYAIYNVNYSLFIIDNRIYRGKSNVIRRKGDILLPDDFVKEIMNAFFPGGKGQKNKLLVLKNKIHKEKPDARIIKKSFKADNRVNENINFVVIDPGHGGKDPGAISRNKIKEKDITLKISKSLLVL